MSPPQDATDPAQPWHPVDSTPEPAAPQQEAPTNGAQPTPQPGPAPHSTQPSWALPGSPAPAPTYGQPTPATHERPSQPPYGQPGPTPYAQQGQPPYGQPGPAPYTQQGQPPYGQPGPAPYTQPVQSPYGQQGQSPYGQQGPVPYGQASQPPYVQPGPSPYAQAGPSAYAGMGQSPYSPAGAAPYGAQGGWPPAGGPYATGQGYPAAYGWGPPAVKGSRVVGPPGGTPFHQMGRTALHRWWRPLVGTLTLGAAALVVTVVAVAVWMVVHYMVTLSTPEPADGRLFENPTEDLAAQLALLGLLTPLVFFTAWVVQRRPMGTVISVVGRMRWRWLLACCGAALVFIAVSYGLNLAVTAVFTKESLGLPWIGWEQFWAPALVILLLVPFQSSAEEFVFRGWLLQAVGSHTLVREDGTRRPLSALFSTPWPAMIVSSAIFVAGHGYTGWAMVDIFAFAMIAAWLAVKTGGLEAPIALHIFNNLMAFLLPAASGDLGDSLKQGGAPWYVLLADIPALLAFSGIVLLLARRYRPATVSPPAPVPPAQPPVPIGHT